MIFNYFIGSILIVKEYTKAVIRYMQRGNYVDGCGELGYGCLVINLFKSFYRCKYYGLVHFRIVFYSCCFGENMEITVFSLILIWLESLFWWPFKFSSCVRGARGFVIHRAYSLMTNELIVILIVYGNNSYYNITWRLMWLCYRKL
jgi:hypothetical protein